MRNIRSIARPRQHPALCLLLALLLALSPLISAAAQAPAAADNAAGAAEHSAQMPCHNHTGSIDAAVMDADCPHCAGDAPATQCECCDQAAPAGLLTFSVNGAVISTRDRDRPAILSDALPRSPGERLYRPPIQSS